MKKFIKFLLLFTLAVVLGTSCENQKLNNPFDSVKQRQKDSVMIVSIIEDRVNPTFSSSDMLIMFRNQLVDNQRQDSLFKSIPIDILRNISDLCIHKYRHVSKKLILEEYDTFMNKPKNIESYQALPPSDTVLQNTSNKRVTVDTIINGKRWVLIEEGTTCVQ
jgi:hypothetical protein